MTDDSMKESTEAGLIAGGQVPLKPTAKKRRPGTTPKGGRPGKYHPLLVTRVLDRIRNGVPKEAAARSVGIAPSTLFDWMQKRPEFSEAVEKAVAESEAILLARVAKAGQEARHWQASAWMLERRWPDRYARRDFLQHEGRVGVDVSLARLREIRERAEAKRKKGAK